MELSLDWIWSIFNRKIAETAVVKVLKVEASTLLAKGDNYASDVKKVKVRVLLGSGKEAVKNIIVKELPATEFKRKALLEGGFFVKETIMYRDVLPSIQDIFDEFGDKSEPMWATMLDYRKYDRIVLEDLADLNFRMGNRKAGLDLPHCELLMKHLAKYHAVSAVLIQRNLIPIPMFRTYFGAEKPEMVSSFIVPVFTKLVESMSSWGDEWTPYQKRIESLIPKATDLFLNSVKCEENSLSVLAHADTWVNNILFLYGIDSEVPVSVRFIDFQLSFIGNPSFDLLYFLASSPNLEVRLKHEQDLIRIYHESLMFNLNKFGYEGERLTLDSLKEELIKKGYLKLHIAVMLLPLLRAEAEDVPDLEEVFKHFDEKKGTKETDMKNLTWANYQGKSFIESFKVVLKDAASTGVI